MAKLFISHCSLDNEIVKYLIEFFQVGMGIARDEIFCTSYPSTIPTGEGFIKKIKEGIENSEAVIFLITPHYLESKFCLAELGAAWGIGKCIYPLLMVDLEAIEKTPLKGIQALFLEKENDVSVMYDEFCTYGVIQKPCTAEYMKRLPIFLEQIRLLK